MPTGSSRVLKLCWEEHRSRDMLSKDRGSLAQGTEPIFCGMAAPSLKMIFRNASGRDLAAADQLLAARN
jgi:hypothetical protein